MMVMMNLKKILPFTILFVCVSANAFAQENPTGTTNLVEKRADLVAVNHPNLSGVETEVREQIVAMQKTLLDYASIPEKRSESLSETYGAMGQVYHAYSFFNPALECYTNASRLSPKDFRWSYLLAKILETSNKSEGAVEQYQKALALNPDYLPTHINLANLYLAMNLREAAKESFENGLKLRSDDPAALYGLAQIKYAEQNYDQAAALFERVLQIAPDANRVHYSLALVFRALKDMEKAKHHLSLQGTVGIRVLDPLFDDLNELKKGVRLRLLRGKLAIEAGRYAEAEAELLKALAVDPENVTALVNYGVILTRVNRAAEASVYFEKAVGLYPTNLNVLFNLAVLRSSQNQHFEAIKYLKTFVKIDPGDNSARFLLAKELRDADLLIESQNEFLIVYKSNPDSEEILLEAIKLLTRKGDYLLAKELLEKSNAKFPERKPTAATLAYLLLTAPKTELRNGKKALELSQKIYRESNSIEYGLIYAMAFAELGQCAKAAEITKELLKSAASDNNQTVIGKLNAELVRFESEIPCSAKK